MNVIYSFWNIIRINWTRIMLFYIRDTCVKIILIGLSSIFLGRLRHCKLSTSHCRYIFTLFYFVSLQKLAFHFLQGTNSKWNSSEKGADRERPPRSNLDKSNVILAIFRHLLLNIILSLILWFRFLIYPIYNGYIAFLRRLVSIKFSSIPNKFYSDYWTY